MPDERVLSPESHTRLLKVLEQLWLSRPPSVGARIALDGRAFRVLGVEPVGSEGRRVHVRELDTGKTFELEVHR